jgi:hypothetical protein
VPSVNASGHQLNQTGNHRVVLNTNLSKPPGVLNSATEAGLGWAANAAANARLTARGNGPGQSGAVALGRGTATILARIDSQVPRR